MIFIIRRKVVLPIRRSDYSIICLAFVFNPKQRAERVKSGKYESSRLQYRNDYFNAERQQNRHLFKVL